MIDFNILEHILKDFTNCKTWFDELGHVGVIEIPKVLEHSVFTFKHEIFEKCEINDLIKLLDFAFENQFELLINTITYVISKKYILTSHNDKFYILYDKQIETTDSRFIISYGKIEISLEYAKLIDEKVIKGHKEFNKIVYTYEYMPFIINIISIPEIKILENPSYDYEDFDVVFVSSNCSDVFEDAPYFIVESNEITHSDSSMVFINERPIKIFHKSSEPIIYFDEKFVSFAHKFFNFDITIDNLNELSIKFKCIFKPNSKYLIELENIEDCEQFMQNNALELEDKQFIQKNRIIIPKITSIEYDDLKRFVNISEIGYYDKNFINGLPEGVESIGAYTFQNIHMTDFKIPNSVKDIGAYAFSNCASLTSVILPNKITTINCFTFAWCKNLQNIGYYDDLGNYVEGLPKTVKKIGDHAFYDTKISDCLLKIN